MHGFSLTDEESRQVVPAQEGCEVGNEKASQRRQTFEAGAGCITL